MALIETVRIVMLDARQEVLLGQRGFSSGSRPGELDFFGGKIEKGEDPLKAARREFHEETGVEFDGPLLPLHETLNQDGADWFHRLYLQTQVERFPDVELSEHIGSVILPYVLALESLPFAPHRQALSRFAS